MVKTIDFSPLERSGLNLIAVLECRALGSEISQMMVDSGVPLAEYRRLVLIGHGGRRMWSALQAEGMPSVDPVDHFAVTHTRRFVAEELGDPSILWLYPGTAFIVPLQRLGQLAGWSSPSPLGLGISPVYGVWYAYRAAFLTTAELPLRTDLIQSSPCETCADPPCVTTCPVGAVKMNDFSVDDCAHFRLADGSPCADRCLARMACPYFPEHQYSLEQMQYHYGHSLKTLRRWYEP